MTKAVTVLAIAGAVTAYVPRSTADPEAVERLVPGALAGEIHVASFGLGRLSGDRTTPITALHVRQTFANRGDDLPWVLDFTAATLTLDGVATPIHPVFVNSDAATLPLLLVERGERRIADVFFPVPALALDERIPSFTITYRIHTADHRYEASAMLARSGYAPTREERGPEVGGARAWWADPAYAWNEYLRRPGPLVPRRPKRIEIVEVPRAFYVEVPLPDDEEEPRLDECNQW